mmetsp:Transcript_4021/g.25272  ORF Transcript_4021/g.25272 Transcript_4021/m.25272 type:complete len:112 (-) Transcript_4021:600-935(-)
MAALNTLFQHTSSKAACEDPHTYSHNQKAKKKRIGNEISKEPSFFTFLQVPPMIGRTTRLWSFLRCTTIETRHGDLMCKECVRFPNQAYKKKSGMIAFFGIKTKERFWGIV